MSSDSGNGLLEGPWQLRESWLPKQECSEEADRGQAVLAAFTIWSCGNVFILSSIVTSFREPVLVPMLCQDARGTR